MADDEWISARDAMFLVSPMGVWSAKMAICKRAHAGLIAARADLLIFENHEKRDAEVPKRFWWAEGHEALEQDWAASDFSTWIGDRTFDKKEMRIFGVKFRKSDIEKLAPPKPSSVKNKEQVWSNRVFIVHGREEGPRDAAAHVLTLLGLEPIILNLKANQGMSVIEKIEAHSDVGYAVVMLTPDDVGNLKGESSKDRARQNVIMELGYFVGKLGRSRVCTFTKGSVEIPSDWAGVVNGPYDEHGAWKFLLGKELIAAKYEIDLNRLA